MWDTYDMLLQFHLLTSKIHGIRLVAHNVFCLLSADDHIKLFGYISCHCQGKGGGGETNLGLHKLGQWRLEVWWKELMGDEEEQKICLPV